MKSKLLYNIVLLCAIGSFAQNPVIDNTEWLATDLTLNNTKGSYGCSSFSIEIPEVVAKILSVGQTFKTQHKTVKNSFSINPKLTNDKFNIRLGTTHVSHINIEVQDCKINQIKNLNNNFYADTYDLCSGLYFVNT